MKRFAALALSCALASPLAAQSVATVNDQEITQKQYDDFIALLIEQGAQDTPELRDQVKQEMIIRMVAVQEAERAGLAEQPNVAQELELARQGILVRALLNDYVKKHPISEADLKAEYEQLKKEQTAEKEYKVKHILVKGKDEAEKLLADIKAKTLSFEEAAKEHSIDLGSGAKGGDLGWAPNTIYVQEFADAVAAQKTGELSAAPVESQFGWHIIQVDEVRDAPMPEFEEVQKELEELLRQQQLTEYQEQLMEKATIK